MNTETLTQTKEVEMKNQNYFQSKNFNQNLQSQKKLSFQNGKQLIDQEDKQIYGNQFEDEDGLQNISINQHAKYDQSIKNTEESLDQQGSKRRVRQRNKSKAQYTIKNDDIGNDNNGNNNQVQYQYEKNLIEQKNNANINQNNNNTHNNQNNNAEDLNINNINGTNENNDQKVINNEQDATYIEPLNSPQSLMNQNKIIPMLQKAVNENNDTIQNKQKSGSISKRPSYVGNAEQYFYADQEQTMCMITCNYSKNYFVIFRWVYFVEFFFLHFLYYCMLGPLINLIFYKKIILMRNLHFWGMQSKTQLFEFVSTFVILVSFYSLNLQNIYGMGEILYIYIAMIIRITSICFKYATFDKFQIYKLKHKLWTPEMKGQEVLLANWTSQTTQMQYQEIHFALRRYDIELPMFYVSFMVQPQITSLEQMYEHVIALSEYHMGAEFQPEPIGELVQKGDNEFIFGYAIIKELIDYHQNVISKGYLKKVLIISLLLSTVKSSIAYFCRWYEAKPILGANSIEGICMVLFVLLQTILMLPIYVLIFQGLRDMNRKLFLMNQLAFMLSPRKIQTIDLAKVLPSINLFSNSSLKGWMLIRKICFSYGRKYHLRMQYNLSMIVVLVLLGIPFIVLSLFKIIVIDIAFQVNIILDLAVFTVITIYFIYQGVQVNQTFSMHQGLLRENKAIITDLYRNRCKYFSPDYVSDNYLYNKGIIYLRNNLEGKCKKQIKKYLKELLNNYEEFCEELVVEEDIQPFTIFGIKMQEGLLQSLGIGLLSIIGTLIYFKIEQIMADNN